MDEVVVTGPDAIPTLIVGNGGTVHEARVRFRDGRAVGVRVVVAFRTVEASSAFRSAATAHGGVLEGNPSGLGGGRPLPPGFVVTFWLPGGSPGAFLAIGP